MGKKFILNFTPTGMIPTKKMTPHVPITPKEIIREILKCAKLGVNIIHIHARDEVTGEPTYKKEVYGKIIKGIREKNKDIILCVSTSGRNCNEFEKRSECIGLKGRQKPDMGSLTLSSLNFNKQASVNSPIMIKKLAKKMLDNNIKPELEVFDLGMINYAKYLIKKGLLKPPYYFNLILGNIACAQADMMHLGLMINELPQNSIWSVGGVGKAQLDMNALSLIGGGGVRIGLEDNIWFDHDRTKLATNKEMIKRILSISIALGKQPYSCKDARKLLKLKK
ncbi:3-keto-5-aminohexanoate cleavage protein [archaeon]|nr:3-keto-5-aminohexanoate cleavage protein [Candidatus Woesearchaeota archaeon]MBT3464356.1 3-keto-5-aminohexanoate cleavage protein [archaeon]MBT4351223.1 3-keto-5-aminohexanoate cleavage protein [archaeon]MBT4647986.1 3-keto-5-aminohexanoate cleavage protein [archaeon]MBT6822651.1 3-keto-5-aminohexanoate cleavage protein [archaeon]